MKLSKINKIHKSIKKTYDITVEKNHNFFCNGFLIHNCDYRNEIGVLLINLGTEPVKIDSTKAIAQIIFENYTDVQFTTVDTLDETERKGGYGSTDKQLGFDPNPSPITNIDSKISKNSSLTDLYQKAGGIPLKEKYTDELEKRTTL